MSQERIQYLERKIKESSEKYANKFMPLEEHIKENLMKHDLMEEKRAYKKVSYIERMKEISQIGDEEEQHVKADDLLCEILKSNGHHEVVEIFENMDKWYS